MKPRTIVKNKINNKIGVIAPDMPGIMRMCEENEALVVYDGATYGNGIDENDLEIIYIVRFY